MSINETIGQNIRSIRESQQLSRIQLASIITKLSGSDVSEYVIGSWQRGSRSISAEDLRYVAIALNVSMYRLYGCCPNPLVHLNDQWSCFSEHERDILRSVVVRWNGDVHALIEFIGLYASLPQDIRYDISGYGITVYEQAVKSGKLQSDMPLPDSKVLRQKWRLLFRKAMKQK